MVTTIGLRRNVVQALENEPWNSRLPLCSSHGGLCREGWTVRTVQGRVLARNPVEGSTEVMARKVRERTISNHRNLTFAVKLYAFGR